MRRVPYVALVLTASLFAAPRCLPAQVLDQSSAEARLEGKSLYLRGLWSVDSLVFRADGTTAAAYETGPFTTAGIDVTHVALLGNVLKIEGNRVAVIFDGHNKPKRKVLPESAKSKKPETISLEIDGVAGTDFAPALDGIFAGDLKDLAPTLPAYWRSYAQAAFVDGGTATAGGFHPTACAEVDASLASLHALPLPEASPATVHQPKRPTVDVLPPKVEKMVDPVFSEAARRLKVSTISVLAIQIGKDGVARCAQVMRAAGAGLDEQAINAVSQYHFKPATREGEPVDVDMKIEVNFQIF